MRLDEGYTLDSMEQVLEHVEAPPGVSDLSGFAVFAGYLVLDALVGNGDRHPGNWAILERQSDGARCLAPTYDHGSALGAGLTADNRRAKDPVAFARRGRANPFSPRKQLLVDLALEAVRRSGADLWVARIAALDEASIREPLEAPQGSYVHRIMKRPFELVVDRVNPVEAGMHMRLLVRLTGELGV